MASCASAFLFFWFEFVDSLEGFGVVGVGVVLGHLSRVAEDTRNNSWRNVVVEGEGCCSGVPAGVGGAALRFGHLKGLVVFGIKVHLVDAYELVCVGLFHQPLDNRDQEVSQNNIELLAAFGFESGASDDFFIQKDHRLFKTEQFTGHHASVYHQDDITSEKVSVVPKFFKSLDFICVEGFDFFFFMDNVPERFSLSPKACQGILRRAQKRGKELPEVLHKALQRQAQV